MKECRDELRNRGLHDTPLYGDLCGLINRQGDWLNKLQIAPFLITMALHTIYGRPAIVLIDEYETPLDHALQRGYLPAASGFFASVFSRLLKVS